MPVLSIIWRFAYVTVLLAIPAAAAVWLRSFTGHVYVPEGKSERIAFSESADISAWRGRVGLPPDMVEFDNPETARMLPEGKTYYTTKMPFALSTVRDEGKALHGIQLTSPQGDEWHGLDEAIHAGDDRYRVVSQTAAWSGLVPHPRGRPCATVALARHGEAEVELSLEADAWAIAHPHVAVMLRWHRTPEEASVAAKADTRPDINGGWWSVADGESRSRFTSFSPGAGTETSDGRVWTLLRVDPGPAARLVFKVEDTKGKTEITVAPNEFDEDKPVWWHAPAACDAVIYLYAWQDEKAVASVFPLQGAAQLAAPVKLGMPLPLADGTKCYIVQLLAYGVLIERPNTEVMQVVLESEDGQRIYLREGASATVGNATLKLSQRPPRPEELTVSARAAGEQGVATTWQLDAPQRLEGWRISHAPQQPSPRGVLLEVYHPGVSLVMIAGYALFVVGAYGWALRTAYRAVSRT